MLFHHLVLSLEIGGGIKHPRRQVALEAARRRSSSLGHELVPTHRRRASRRPEPLNLPLQNRNHLIIGRTYTLDALILGDWLRSTFHGLVQLRNLRTDHKQRRPQHAPKPIKKTNNRALKNDNLITLKALECTKSAAIGCTDGKDQKSCATPSTAQNSGVTARKEKPRHTSF